MPVSFGDIAKTAQGVLNDDYKLGKKFLKVRAAPAQGVVETWLGWRAAAAAAAAAGAGLQSGPAERGLGLQGEGESEGERDTSRRPAAQARPLA
mmetsp:Transcript_7137/g.20924  ORF Transcript_7137/g.20924 Transcript_7137/m.20924 type:complete len:94 (-) Transcript_7137:1475-1756(-)